jgi:hypothetical protein
MREVAKHLSAMGRHGDSMLVHMSPAEVKALHGIGSLTGSEITINPKTGLPEAFSFGDFFKSLLPTIVGAVAAPFTGGSSLIPVLAGAATGAVLNKDNPLMGALTGGIGGFGGAGIGGALGKSALAGTTPSLTSGTLNAANVATNATNAANAAGTLSNVANPLAGANLANAVAQQGVMGSGALYSGFPQGVAGGVQGMVGGPSGVSQLTSGLTTAQTAATPSGLSSLSAGIKNLGTEAGRGAFTEALGGTGPNADLIAAGKVALPVGMGALSAIEPPAMPQEKEEKYDPYATLNLSGDSGLRFFAEGGSVFETPDSGSNPLQDAQDARSYGIGGLSYASGGNVGLFADKPGLNIGTSGGLNSGYSPQQFEQYYNAYRADQAMTRTPFSPNFAFMGNRSNLNKLAEQRGVSLRELMKNPNAGLADEQIQFNKMMQGASPVNTYNDPFRGYGTRRNLTPEQKQFNTMLADYNKQGSEYLKSQVESQFTPVQKAAKTLNIGSPYGANGYNVSGYSKPLSIWANNQEDYGQGLFGQQGLKFAKGGYLDGPGDGMSDSIPATIEGKQPARLADGEFVVPADVVSHLGNGSTKAGAQHLYAMMDKVRKARTGTKKQGKQIKADKYLPA